MSHSTFAFPPKHTTGPRPPVMFYDRPMGTGKTRDLLKGFDPETRYLVVHEYLEQCQDVIDNPAGVHFEQPQASKGLTKGEHLEQLIRKGKNIVTTHALYPSLVELAKDGWLRDYVIIIDETLDPVKCPKSPKKGTWEALVRDGYAAVDKHGKVIPSAKWYERQKDVSDVLTPKLLADAMAGLLYVTENRHMFIVPIPVELLTAGNSVTVMTFMSEGSVLSTFLDRLEVPYVINRDIQQEAKLRREIRRWVKLKDIPALSDVSLSYTGQTTSQGRHRYTSKVATALQNIRQRQIQSVPLSSVIVGCAKDNWYRKLRSDHDETRPDGFSKNSRMFGANWVAPGIRGKNDYRHCSVVISLYDYHLNAGVLEWLNREDDRKFKERYAVSELLQFVYRSRIRCRSAVDDPSITLYLPCGRMRRLFLQWVNSDAKPEERLRVS